MKATESRPAERTVKIEMTATEAIALRAWIVQSILCLDRLNEWPCPGGASVAAQVATAVLNRGTE